MDAASVVLKPPKLYASTFLDASFVGLFFKLMAKVRTSEDHLHHVVQCLTQLASLTKPVFSTDEEQQSYVANFVAGILGYVSSRSASCLVTKLSSLVPRLPPAYFDCMKKTIKVGNKAKTHLVRCNFGGKFC